MKKVCDAKKQGGGGYRHPWQPDGQTHPFKSGTNTELAKYVHHV